MHNIMLEKKVKQIFSTRRTYQLSPVRMIDRISNILNLGAAGCYVSVTNDL